MTLRIPTGLLAATVVVCSVQVCSVLVYSVLVYSMLACFPRAALAQEVQDPKRGEYLVLATGGCGCHTDYKKKGAYLAGGRGIKTPFGVAYGSNITADKATGLGGWSEEDFIRAMTQGVGLHGKELFPVFPYTSFTRIAPSDLRDMWAYLRTVTPVNLPSKDPDFMPPFSFRIGVKAWKLMNFTPGPFQPDPAQSAVWNRGAYMVTALGHCAECHTPRNLAGALKASMAYAGSVDGPEGQLAPNITPDEATGLGKWSLRDISYYLETGTNPDGDVAEGLMGELIENGYSKLTESDLTAIATYLKALKPIKNKLEKKEKEK
jgi:mono/diheme cytochrome c family protein